MNSAGLLKVAPNDTAGGKDLREVKAAIQEGTESKLSRLGKAGSSCEATSQHPLHTHPSPMALQLHHILAGV